MKKDLTTGSVLGNILFFSLPYLLSYFLQTLYGMADLFIIGQFEGVAATTAVSVGSQAMHMITVMIVGLAMGTTVNIGQAVGAGDQKRAAAGLQRNILRLLFCPPSIIWKKLPTSGFSYKQSQNGYKTVSKTFIFVDGVTEWGYT